MTTFNVYLRKTLEYLQQKERLTSCLCFISLRVMSGAQVTPRQLLQGPAGGAAERDAAVLV